MGPKKKKKSKKQQREEELMAERLKREEAEEKARAAEAQQRELERQKMEAKMKAQREMLEQTIRDKILSQISLVFKQARLHHFHSKIKQRSLEEWTRYLNCNRLPYPESAPIMHTHLFLWKSLKETEELNNAMERAEIVLNILNILDQLIEEPLDATSQTIQNWKEIRNNYRFQTLNKIDIGCFHLIRKILSNLNRVDFWTVDFKKSSANIKIQMWGWLDEPVSDIDRRAPPSVDFSESGVAVKLPIPYNKELIIIRVIHVTYDHYSDMSNSWNQPNFLLDIDLMDVVSKWYSDKENLKEERAQRDKILQAEQEQIAKDSSPPILEEDGQLSVSEISEEKESVKEIDETVEDIRCPTPVLTTTDQLPDRPFAELLATYNNIIETDLSKQKLVIHSNEKTKTEKDLFEKKMIKFMSQLCPPITEYDVDKSVTPIGELILNFDTTKIIELTKPIPMSRNVMKCLGKMFDVPVNLEDKLEKKNDNSNKDIAQILEEEEEKNHKKYREAMYNDVSKNELNLRKFCILGGVFYIDLIKHVPQEFQLNNGTIVQMQYGKYNIIRDKFCFIYEPPKITETSEDDEEKPPPDDNIDRLIFVEVTLPQHVLWFEAPTVVLWDKEQNYWSNEHVYDIKFNEEKQVISCRIGRPDPLGLAAVRYNNLPLQTWELRPEWSDSNVINLSLTASTVILEFLIKQNKVALQCLQNATGTALESIVGQYFFPHEIISIMKKAGVDLFPGNDTFLYVEGHCAKTPIIEQHVYLCMAMFANIYQFTWSRWNMPAGRNMIVYQMREALSKTSLTNYYMVMSTLYRTAIVDCSEVSPSFSEKSIQENSFYPDLYSLLCSVTSSEGFEELHKMDIDLILTVYEMLCRTKVFSYS